MIKNVIFDFGGVIMTIDHPEAIRRFKALGFQDAEKELDPWTQGGIFGMIEEGKIDDEEFRLRLSQLCHRELSWNDCQWACIAYRKEVPARNIEFLRKLRNEGYRLIMLSNTNPYMMAWAMSPDFSRLIDRECMEGRPVSDYFDAVYLSYKIGAMKPDPRFYKTMMETEQLNPAESIFIDDGQRNIEAGRQLGMHTFCPKNGEDWTDAFYKTIKSIE